MDEVSPENRNKPKGYTDVGVQAFVRDPYRLRCEISIFTLLGLCFVSGISSVLIGTYCYVFKYGPRYHIREELVENIGHQGALTFRQYDRDGDGYLSLLEFEPLSHKLSNITQTYNYSDIIQDGDEVLTVQSSFEPLQLETMSKDDESLHNKFVDSLLGLKSWRVPASSWQNFGAGHFKAFLPPSSTLEASHEVYDLIHSIDLRGSAVSSNRYFPQELFSDGEIMIHRLLSMFHPRPFIYPRFAPQGSIACVRAYNDKYVDIVFRIHAEFQLNEPPIHPFWFTPAQFTGHVLMRKDASRVLQFHMFVPTDKRLNVDMEWLNGGSESDNMEVDIGYMNKMELKSPSPSVPMYQKGVNIKDEYLSEDVFTDSGDLKLINSMTWDKEISFTEAARILQVHLYPFKEVQYFNFSDVWPVAKQQNKPVHSIVLWGALDDQSC